MISNRIRESRRGRAMKLPKNIDRLYREGKCRECSVVVTRMDFAKILGKFTKVKIQYEKSSASKTKKNSPSSPNSNSRLKSNENGMVLIHRNAYSQHPVKELLSPKNTKPNEPSNANRGKHALKENSKLKSSPNQVNNVLKENNRLQKSSILKDSNYNNRNAVNCNLKRYGIVFVDPTVSKKKELKSKTSLLDLLPDINKDVLPTEEWCIDYYPMNDEPKDDKVYDRIAAELEDLMCTDKTILKPDKNDGEQKVDDYPSIMDILNDDTGAGVPKVSNQSEVLDSKSNLQSSDVEAMLLGKSSTISKENELVTMDVDNTDVSNLIEDVAQLNTIENSSKPQLTNEAENVENPHSPSILDETLQKGIEEHLPAVQTLPDATASIISDTKHSSQVMDEQSKTNNDVDMIKLDESIKLDVNAITHVVFKLSVNGKCYKSVTCPRNLNYRIELEGKCVELIGAPKYLSNLEDLQVLLQIVNESELDSLYVLH